MTTQLTRRTAIAGLATSSLATSAFIRPAFAQAAPVVLYTSNPAQAVEAVLDVARKALPNVKISTVTGGSGQLLRRIEAEAAKPQADVFWTSSANTLGAFKQFYEPYKVKDADAILPALRHPENLWTAANMHVAVLMVNTAQLGGLPAPKTYAELLDPKYKGKMIIADPANSSTGYTILWGIDKMLGADGLKALANNIKQTASAPTVLRSVAQGEFPIGLTFESNAYGYVAGGQKEISLVYPSDGTFTTPEFYTLIKGAPGQAAAKQLCDLLASKEVQTALLETAFRRPVRTDIEVGKIVKLPELSTIKVFATNEEEAAAQRKSFLERWAALVAAAGN
jgi:iron(III) transport system substrate-binding protein